MVSSQTSVTACLLGMYRSGFLLEGIAQLSMQYTDQCTTVQWKATSSSSLSKIYPKADTEVSSSH